MIEQDNLTAKQLDEEGRSKTAVFLPALSSFYATYVGKQRHFEYIEQSRIPPGFQTGIEGLNWLNTQEAYFPYKWALYSAGHAELDVNKHAPRDDMVRNRDRDNSFILGDSGGFQIGKLVWEGDWKDPNCPNAMKKRKQVLSWLDSYMDRGMILDVPSWAFKQPGAAEKIGIRSYADAVTAVNINNDYFMKERSGQCKFLNVLQGEDHAEADDWYDRMKHYCDPKKHERPFEGWAMGGQNMCDIHLVLRRLVAMRHDGLLEKGRHDWIHFLGTSKLEWALLLTDIQNAVRKYHNENLTISFDCASPFLATANGQIYQDIELIDRGKWTYRMGGSVDDKKYATDSRSFRDVILQDGFAKQFIESPISARLKISDICCYKPGDLNKIGKEGRTSWDSFSYTLQMGHNVWTHIHAVQEANRAYAAGTCPSMLVREIFDRTYTRDVINEIFATSDRGKAEALIDHHSKLWMQVIGSRGSVGKKSVNSGSMFKSLFDTGSEDHPTDDSGLDETNLQQLEVEAEN